MANMKNTRLLRWLLPSILLCTPQRRDDGCYGNSDVSAPLRLVRLAHLMVVADVNLVSTGVFDSGVWLSHVLASAIIV